MDDLIAHKRKVNAMKTLFFMNNADAKKKLETYENIAMGANPRICPHLFLKASQGTGVSTFGELYCEVLKRNNVFGRTGCDFLELAFPGNGQSEKTRALFYESCKEKARSIGNNDFYGVFVVSLEELENVNLKDNWLFEEFLAFVNDNRESMRFVLVCQPTALNCEEMERRFQRICPNIDTVELLLPNSEVIESYLENALTEHHIFLNKTGKRTLQKFAERLEGQEGFSGFRTLQYVSDKMVYMCLSDGQMCLTPEKELLIRAFDSAFECLEEKGTKDRKIGFC